MKTAGLLICLAGAACGPVPIPTGWTAEDIGAWQSADVLQAAADLLEIFEEVEPSLEHGCAKARKYSLTILSVPDPLACGEVCETDRCAGCSAWPRTIFMVVFGSREVQLSLLAHELLHQVMSYNIHTASWSQAHDSRFFGEDRPGSVLGKSIALYLERHPIVEELP